METLESHQIDPFSIPLPSSLKLSSVSVLAPSTRSDGLAQT